MHNIYVCLPVSRCSQLSSDFKKSMQSPQHNVSDLISVTMFMTVFLVVYVCASFLVCVCVSFFVLNCFYAILILQHVRLLCANKYYLIIYINSFNRLILAPKY